MDQQHKSTAELDAIVPSVWSAAWYPTLFENLIVAESVAMDYQGEIAALGDTVNISSFPQFPDAVDLGEGARNDANAITVANIPMVVNHEVVQDFIITRKAAKQSLEAQEKLREHAFFSIMKKMDQIILADIVPSASAPDHTISFDSGTTLALADILEGKELLDTQNVPDNGQRVAILGVAQYNDLFNIAGFVSRDFSPNANALSQGSITAPVLGFRVKFTTLIGDTAYLWDPVFMQMAVQESPVPEVFNLGVDGVRAFRVNQTVLFGNKQADTAGKRVVKVG
mgnify:CR=1 FL=1